MECASNNPHGCDPQGSDRVDLQWGGKQLIVDIHYDHDGKKMLWHERFFDITPTTFTQSADSGEAGTPLKSVLTIQATKIRE